ncbi:MAG: hypothetical protein IT479_04280 [Xanthomonadales bacterium]|nr:hypothetical protein [Xanthomonadales bacterium]MCC6592470.1 hypothetical protein [Xanthomonadales bacterium]MCE7930129.1 hypothetical protein [Xanthomonadales bacterium PRO6]
MSLRLRYYLAILPLFLGLGLINSLLVWYTERNELEWGLRERAQGAAASIAGFWDQIAPQATDSPAAELERYSRRLGAVSIAWFEPGRNQWTQRTLFDAEGVPPPAPPFGAVATTLRAGGLAWELHSRDPSEGDLNVGYAPLHDAAGGVRAVIGIAEIDRSLQAEMLALRRRLGGLLLALLLAGILATELVARIARGELAALTSAARDAAHGRYLSHWPAGRIRELNDLGGTLLTMTSLLADEKHQTRRRFFQAEPLPGDEELANAYRAQLGQPLPPTLGQVQCAQRRIGRPTPEDFCGWREGSAGWYLCVGRCRAADGDPDLLARLVRADAAREFLLGVATARPHGPSWPEALRVHPCESLQLILVPASGQAPTGWTLDPARGRPQPWSPGDRREVLSTLAPEAHHIAQAYANQFPDRPVDQIAEELSGLLGTRHDGLLVICDLQTSRH